jgi:hypothetical protein
MHPRRTLLLAGSALVVASDLAALKWTADSGLDGGLATAAIPVVGPWLVLARANREHESHLAFLMILDGIAQAAGATLIGASVFVPRDILIGANEAVVTAAKPLSGAAASWCETSCECS